MRCDTYLTFEHEVSEAATLDHHRQTSRLPAPAQRPLVAPSTQRCLMPIRRNLLVGLALLGFTLSLLSPGVAFKSVAAQPTGSTSLISYAAGRLPSTKTSPGTYTHTWSAAHPVISADGGRIAFATNLSLVNADANGITDIYLYDRSTQQHILASPTYTGTEAAGIDAMTTLDLARIAPNGRYVAFASSSNRLAAGDSIYADVFVFDEQNGKVHLVSSSTANGASSQPDVADDGTVVFGSSATNLLSDTNGISDTNGKADIFLKPVNGPIERISVASDGTQANDGSSLATISRDGRWVAFTSFASNLVISDTNAKADIFVRDRLNNQTFRVSVSSAGVEGNAESRLSDLAVNGTKLRVSFQSSASNLVADDTNAVDDVFVYERDIATGTTVTRRVSVSSTGVQGDQAAGVRSVYYWPSLTNDGRFVVFPSLATNLDLTDSNNAVDLFIRDVDGGSTERVSVGSDGAQPGLSTYGSAADGGQLISFHAPGSLSPMAAASNMQNAVFLRDRQRAATLPSVGIVTPEPATVVRLPLTTVLLRSITLARPNTYLVGYAWFSDRDGLIAQTPSVTLPATRFSVGTHQISFIAIDNNGDALAATPQQLEVLDPTQQGAATLIVTNMTRMRQLYPNNADVANLEALLPTLAAHAAVNGHVLDLNADAATAQAYATWAASPTTVNANLVVEKIKAQVDAFWRTNAALRYLVLVGDDRVVPFRRIPDTLPTVLNTTSKIWLEERDYAAQVQFPATTTVGAALRDNQILTDDYYGYNTIRYSQSTEPEPRYYVPELGLGRLVESPAAIMAQVNAFLTASSVTVQQAAVTAWGLTSDGQTEMLADGGRRTCQTLAQDGIGVDCTSVGLPIDAATYTSQFLGSGVRNTILAFHHHANHTNFAPNASDAVSFINFANAPADLSRALLLSAGCHAGLNVPPDNLPYTDDLAQVITGRTAVYLGSTGYGIACDMCIGWTEALLDYFTTAIVAGANATPGEALAFAKARYQRDTFYPTSTLGDQEADAKASLQLTLYGLPMYSYVTPSSGTVATARDDGVAVTQTQATLAGGLTVNSYSYQFPPLEETVIASGRYYALQGNTIAGQAQPIQPRYTADMTFPNTRAHGVVFRGGKYSTLANFDPVVAAMVNEYVMVAEPSISGASWRPALPARLNKLNATATMVAALGQYQPATQTERIYEQLALDLYYHPDSTDWEAPLVTKLDSTRSGDQATITIRATDPSGIAAVVVAYTNGDGTWASVSLTEGTSAWTGTIPATASTRLLVQAVDGAGNVTALDNGGEYYATTATVATPLQTYLPYLAR